MFRNHVHVLDSRVGIDTIISSIFFTLPLLENSRFKISWVISSFFVRQCKTFTLQYARSYDKLIYFHKKKFCKKKCIELNKNKIGQDASHLILDGVVLPDIGIFDIKADLLLKEGAQGRSQTHSQGSESQRNKNNAKVI